MEGDATEILRRLGWNAQNLSDLNLVGHDDQAVFAAAWKEDRILLTKDHDFLDDRRFPENRNPGLIILPDARVESDVFLNALSIVTYIFRPLREAYRKTKIVISSDGTFRIINRNNDTGAMEHQRYRSGKHGETYIWNEPAEYRHYTRPKEGFSVAMQYLKRWPYALLYHILTVRYWHSADSQVLSKPAVNSFSSGVS